MTVEKIKYRKNRTESGWWNVCLDYSRRHWFYAGFLFLSSITILVLFLQSLFLVVSDGVGLAMQYAVAGGLAGFAGTALGAIPALILRRLPAYVEDTMLGFAAGMMMAASAFSLILPGLAAGTSMTGNKAFGAGIVVLGMACGVILMLSLDKFTPHEHETIGSFGPGNDRLNKVWLFVFAISLHHLPEGMAIGVGFSHADMAIGLPLTIAIVLQDIPEGLAVALALRSAGVSRLRAVLIAGATGLFEPLGSLLGVGLSSGLALSYPIGLGFAAGAMLFVVSHEVIPETHRNGHQTPATVGLMAGFALMMVLDTTLG